MIRIKCINPKCTAPSGIFEFDDSKIGAAGPASLNEPSAMRYIINCPFCNTKNMVWLKRSVSSFYGLDAIFVKDEPQDIR